MRENMFVKVVAITRTHAFEIRNKSFLSPRLCVSAVWFSFSRLPPAQAPAFEKIDPPSWWVGSTINPVRVLIKGKNLGGARIESATPGITADNFMSSENGNYLFADVRLAETVRPGNYQLRIVTSRGSVNAPFEVFTPQQRLGNYNGFTVDDVIYFVFTERFADGDPTNNDPPKSKGLYDRKKGRHYHGGDLQGYRQAALHQIARRECHLDDARL